MQDHRLVLYPLDHAVAIDAGQLRQVLAQTGLIGEPHAWHNEQHYLPGEHFLEQVIFLGCSPYINLAPPGDDGEGGEYCHVGLFVETGGPVFLGGDNVRPPTCPYCKQPIENWRKGLEEGAGFSCPACGEAVRLRELKWRRGGAFASCSVHIWGVHDGEAVPSEGLLRRLGELSGCKWGYFYRQSR